MITEQKEIRLWQWLKRKFDAAGVDAQRIENTTGCGVPDVNACYMGSDVWLELKVYVQGNVVLRKEQYAWLMRRHRVDGNVGVLAHNPETDEIEFWEPPFEVRKWGNNSQYVALVGEPDYQYDKTVDTRTLLRALFGL